MSCYRTCSLHIVINTIMAFQGCSTMEDIAASVQRVLLSLMESHGFVTQTLTKSTTHDHCTDFDLVKVMVPFLGKTAEICMGAMFEEDVYKIFFDWYCPYEWCCGYRQGECPFDNTVHTTDCIYYKAFGFGRLLHEHTVLAFSYGVPVKTACIAAIAHLNKCVTLASAPGPNAFHRDPAGDLVWVGNWIRPGDQTEELRRSIIAAASSDFWLSWVPFF